MIKHRILAVFILASASLPLAAYAESPWESGSFKGYDDQQQAAPSAPAGDADTGAVGLQGFSLAPSVDETPPAAPVVTAAPKAAAQKTQKAVAPSTTQAQTTKSPLLDAAMKSAMGAAADMTFVMSTQRAIDAMIQEAQLAQKSATSDMQKFAAQLESIYSGIEDNIAGIAKKNNIQSTITLPPSKASDKLATLTGKDFDKKFMQLQRQNLSMLDIAFKKEAKDGQNTELKTYAAKQLGVIDKQKDMIVQANKAASKQAVAAAVAAAQSAHPNSAPPNATISGATSQAVQ